MNVAIRAEDRGWWFSRTLIGAAVVCAAFFTSYPHAGASGNSGYPVTAEGLVEQAEKAAVDGDTARQFALLREAVRIDPQYQLARWQLGQVEVDGKWITVEEAQRRTASDPKQAEYRRRRAEFDESPAGQLGLARWCRKNDLEEESRFHWASVLSNQPEHREALRALGLRWTDGQLMSRPEIQAAREERFETRQASREWQSKLAKWQRALARNADSNRQQTLDEIRAIDDPEAIPTLESVTLAGSPTDSSPSPRLGEMSLAFITALENMSDHAATESLLRHALLSPFATVLLVGCRAAPIPIAARFRAGAFGLPGGADRIVISSCYGRRWQRNVFALVVPPRIACRFVEPTRTKGRTIGGSTTDRRAAGRRRGSARSCR